MVLSANEEQMNSKIANNLYSKKTPLQPPNGKKVELRGSKRQAAEKPMPDRRRSSRERKLVLLQDVENLKKKLRHEENVHRALQRAFNRPLGALPRLPPYLPQDTLELLAEVAVLEEEVVRLEEQVVNFRQGLYQEAYYTSSRDELDLELSMRGGSKPRHSRASSQSEVDSPCVSRTPSSRKLVYDGARKQQGCVLENGLVRESRLENDAKSCSDKKPKLIGLTPVKKPPLKPSNSPKMQCRIVEQAQESSCSSSDDKTVEIESEANKMSQDILNCLISIFVRMSSSRRKTVDFSSLGSKAFSEKETSFRDPYFNSSELKKREIGNYKHLYVIEAHSVDLNRRSTASFLIRRLRILLDKLASTKVDGLSHHQKLAFWINIYNACIMNEFLEHGIPQSPEMMVVQMQKATVKVGGHALNAVTIEHLILRLPYHLKYTCTKSSKNDEKAICRTLGLEWSEALVTFALSNGSWSSPALRVYTAVDIESELEAAKKAYLQAAVGISSSNKLVVPKLLEWYLLDFAKDMDALLDWICLELPDEVRNEAVKCLESRDKEPLAKLVQVMPYNFSFRYLVYR